MTRKKGAHGEGGFRQLPNGNVQWRGTVKTLDGKSVAVSVTRPTRRAANQARLELLATAQGGKFAAPNTITVGTWLDEWLASKQRLARKTREDYERHVRLHITPLLGALKLQELTPAKLSAFYSKLSKQGKGIPTLQKVHVILHGALKQAVILEIVARNVADIVKPEAPRDADIRDWTASVWTPEDARRFAPVAMHDRWGRLLLLLLHTGMRRGEACALQWDNIDLQKGELHVRRSLDQNRNFTTPKTAKSKRTLALSDDATKLLEYHREQQQIERAAQGDRWTEHGMVFPTTVGTPERADNLRRHFHRLCDVAGIPRIRIHDLRHTFTSLMIAAGAPLTIVSEKLGHEDPDFTWKRYGHTYKSQHARWALNLSELTREEE